MVGSDVADRFVILRDGLIVPAPAYLLLLDLEARGFTLARDGDTLVVTPHEQLTRQDCAACRRWKWHLILLLAYCTRVDLDAHLFTDTRPTASMSTTTRTA